MDFISAKLTPDILKVAVANEHEVEADTVTISNLNFKSGSNRGDGFTCDIAAVDFTATISGNEPMVLEKHYIAKYGPDGRRGELLEEFGAFKQENLSYTWLVPQLQKLRAANHLKPLAIPKCFYSSPNTQLMIFENLKCQGYVTVERSFEPLSLESIKLVLIELAALHATGYHYIKSHPGGLKDLQASQPDIFVEDFFGRNSTRTVFNEFINILNKMFVSCATVAKKFGSDGLGDRMMAFKEKVKDLTDTLLDEMPEKMAIVLHGDAWFNNFMYRFSEGDVSKPLNVAILDFQNTRLGRVGLELGYFFCSSVTPNQRKKHLDELLNFYYERFIQELKDFGSDLDSIFTFEELKNDVDQCYGFGFITGCMHAQTHLVADESSAGFTLDNYNDEEAMSNMMDALEVDVLAKADKSPEFRDLILGLVEDAAQRNII